MLKITYYIFRQLGLATLMLASVLTCAIWLTQSLRFVDGVVNKGFPLTTFLNMVVLLLPELIGVVLPFALLFSTIYIYNRLTADHELSVMRSAGMSYWQLAKPTLIVTSLVTIVLYSINLYFIPVSFKNLRDIEYDIRNTSSAAMLQEGEFHTFKGLTVYIRSRKSLNDIRGILIYNSQEKGKPFLVTSEAGSIIETDEGMRLILLNGARQDTDQKTGNPSMLYFEQYTVDIKTPATSRNRRRGSHERFVHELLYPDPETATKSAERYIAQGHMRLLGPLHAVAYALIALSILLFGEINRRRRTKRILAIMALCGGLQVATLTLINIAEKHYIAILLSYLIIIVSILLPLAYIKEWLQFPSLDFNRRAD